MTISESLLGITGLFVDIIRFSLSVIFSASKGFWAEMLGVGDFYYELGVQIIEVCLATSHRNGGKHEIP